MQFKYKMGRFNMENILLVPFILVTCSYNSKIPLKLALSLKKNHLF